MPWQIVAGNSEILAIHAALLPTNQILMFGGSEHNATQNRSGNPADLDNTRLFNLDAAGPLIETIGSPTTDVFCSGHALLSDGRLLVAGGTEKWGGAHPGHGHDLNFLGEKGCWVYRPRARSWRRVRDLNFEPGASDGGGRWYPNLVTLATGEVLAVAGHPTESDSRHNNDTPERYSAGSDTWTLLTAERLDVGVRSRYYPRFHLTPDGNVFVDSPVGGSSRLWNPFTGQTVSTVGSPGGGLYDSTWNFPSVLLPLLPDEGYAARVLACGDVDARTVDLSQAGPAWQTTAARQGAAAGKQRGFANAVLLPTGLVFVCGGIDGGFSDANAVKEGELYDPGIDWAAGRYSNPDSWQSVEAATVVRNYHSTALLLPDGRVWTAGSSKNADQGDPSSVGELRIEAYEPAYFADPQRPTLTASPPSVGYDQRFEVRSPDAESIRRVVITRCGSTTHAFDGDQRHVGLVFRREEGDVLEVTSPPNSRIAPPGYYLLWLLDNADRPCARARFLRICPQRLILITDRSTFSNHEVQALGTPATFANALYVVLDGFLPHEAGEPPVAPTLTLTRPDGSAVPGMSTQLNRVLYEDDTLPPDVAQRITFVFNIRFTSLQAFADIPAADDSQTITLSARHGGNSEQAPLVLSKNPNPYMRDGAVHWLSTDLRVFKIRPGLTRAGVTLSASPDGPITFVQDLLDVFDAASDDEDHPFFDISGDPQASQLELASRLGGQPIYNFAIAKVRYRAPAGIDATDVRVFFRLFTTAATNLAYTTAAYPRQGSGGAAAPLLGLAGNDILSIPFFAEARVADMRVQPDAPNRKTISGSGAVEVTTYFGCWLDFNQPTVRFPLHPTHNGSAGAFTGPLLSVQELLRNHHLCLAAEIHFPLDPIPSGATPGSHDNLSQRNLVVVESTNPGSNATRTVQTGFELKPSLRPLVVPQAFGVVAEPPREPEPAAARAVDDVAAEPEPARPQEQDAAAAGVPAEAGEPAVASAELEAGQRKRFVEHDELLIRWNDLPRDSHVSIYLPDVDTDEVVAAAAARQGPPMLRSRDGHTLLCDLGDVSYIPIPGPRQVNIPGLLSIQLPPSVTKGEQFTVTAHQVSGYPRRIIGGFQLTVPVVEASEILSAETRKLAVLRHIGRAIPVGDRWRPVWDRFLEEVADRVRGLGGNPAGVEPSPTGELPPGEDRVERDVVIGRVARLLYDCDGAFEGFVLETCGEERTFRVRKRGLERVALTACRHNLRVKVWLEDDDGPGVRRIALLC